MSAILFHAEPNGPSFTVLAAAFETGYPVHLEYLDLANGARHGDPRLAGVEVAMSVEGEGPVLVVDGEAMADSVFLACYFDECAGGAQILPADAYERWAIMTWCRQTIERTAPAAAYLGTQAYLTPRLRTLSDAAFEAKIAPIVSDDLRQRWIEARANAYDPVKVKDSEEKIAAAIAKIEAQLGVKDWLFSGFSIADLETYAWVAGMKALLPQAFEEKIRTNAWLDRVSARPCVRRALTFAATSTPLAYWAPGPEINRWG